MSAEPTLASLLFEEDKLSTEAALEVVDELMVALGGKVDDIYLGTLDVAYATELAMLKMKKVLDWAVLGHDGVYADEEPLEEFSPDAEPLPSQIDSWARGTVAVKKIALEEPHIPHSFSSETLSVSSYGGTGSHRSRSSSRSSRGRGSAPMRISENQDKAGQIIELDEDGDGDFGNLGSTGFMFDLLQKTERKKHKGFDVEADAEKGEFALMQEQLEQGQKELRGRKFVLDRYGKPVLVGAVRADKLTPFRVPLELSIVDPTKEGEDLSTDSSRVGRRAGSAPGGGSVVPGAGAGGEGEGDRPKKKKQFRVAGSRGVDESSFKPTLSLATALSGVESVPKLNPGVSVRSATSVRTGDKLPDDPKRMSRKQYLAQSISRAEQSIDSMSRTLDSSSSYSNTNATDTRSRVSGGSVGKSRSYGGAGGGSVGSVTAMRSIDELPDMDYLEGSRQLPSQATAMDLSDEDLGLGPVNSMGQASTPSPTRMPSKPSAGQRAVIDLLSGSPENGKPRDRDMPKNMVHVANRKHLPAPPLGRIVGHGLSLDQYSQKKDLSNEVAEDWHQNWRG